MPISLVKNHAFVDGNTRVAHAALEVFLLLNGAELRCHVDGQEAFWLGLAGTEKSKADLVAWLADHTVFEGSEDA